MIKFKGTPCKAWGHNYGRNKWGACVECERLKGLRNWQAGWAARQQKRKLDISRETLQGSAS